MASLVTIISPAWSEKHPRIAWNQVHVGKTAKLYESFKGFFTVVPGRNFQQGTKNGFPDELALLPVSVSFVPEKHPKANCLGSHQTKKQVSFTQPWKLIYAVPCTWRSVFCGGNFVLESRRSFEKIVSTIRSKRNGRGSREEGWASTMIWPISPPSLKFAAALKSSYGCSRKERPWAGLHKKTCYKRLLSYSISHLISQIALVLVT